MKQKFKTPTKSKLAEFVYDLKDSFNPENLSERTNPCIHIKFSEELIKEILNSKKLTQELKKKITAEIKFSKKEIKETEKFIDEFKKYWSEEINNKFFNEMKKIFGEKYIKKEYFCYPTNKVTGAYFGKNEITILFNYKPKIKLNKLEFSSIILAEEILHLIYWELWQDLFNKKIRVEDLGEIFSIEGPKWSCWHIAEIIPEYLLINNPNFKKFNWHKDNRVEGYPWIPKLKKILDPVWKNSKSIKDFIIKAHEKLGIKIK